VPNLIAFPFRLNGVGHVTTYPDNDDEYYAGELAMLVMTRTEERVLVPDYGCTDPTFGTFSEVELRSQVDLFGPPVSIGKVMTTTDAAGTQQIVTIEFSSTEPFSDSDIPRTTDLLE
jgi:hypothetical protein